MKTKWQGKGLYDVFVSGVDDEGNSRYTYQWTRYYDSMKEFMGTHIYTKMEKYLPEWN
jgi:hypothetical protein